MIRKLDPLWRGPLVNEYIESPKPWDFVVLSYDGFTGETRDDAKRLFHNALDAKEAGLTSYKDKPRNEIKTCYLFSCIPDAQGNITNERNITITHHTRSGGDDSIWLPSCGFLNVHTGKNIPRPTYFHFAIDSEYKQMENPVEYDKYAVMYENFVDNNIYPSISDLRSLHFTSGNDVFLLFECIKAARLEQDVKRKPGQGPYMMMAEMAPSRERMKTTMDFQTGEIYGRHIFGMGNYLKPFMELNVADDILHKLHNSARFGYLESTGHACIVLVPTTRHFIFAYGPNGEWILMPYEVLDSTGLHCMLQERTHDQSVMEAWFQQNVASYATSVHGWRADFSWGYVALLPDGRADICLYQAWTDKDIVKKINGFKKNAWKISIFLYTKKLKELTLSFVLHSLII